MKNVLQENGNKVMKKEVLLNEKEGLAKINSGIESEATHVNVNDKQNEQSINVEKIEEFNTQCDTYTQQINKRTSELENSKMDISDLELMPLFDNIIVKMYNNNPFQKITFTKSGLFLDNGGMDPIYSSQETGELGVESSEISVGEIIEVGSDCKYVQVGDVVMWTTPSEVPIPFFRQGFKLINERRVIVVINKNLKSRLKK